jgi:hypothetical protein
MLFLKSHAINIMIDHILDLKYTLKIKRIEITQYFLSRYNGVKVGLIK